MLKFGAIELDRSEHRVSANAKVYFQMPGGQASALAGCFGLMNLFARSLGGIFSDVMFARYAFPGRLWAQFLSLFFEGVFLFVFGCVSNDYQWYHALAALICFSLCVQMAEGNHCCLCGGRGIRQACRPNFGGLRADH